MKSVPRRPRNTNALHAMSNSEFPDYYCTMAQGKTNHTSCSIQCYKEHRLVHLRMQAAYPLDGNASEHSLEHSPVTLEDSPSREITMKSSQPGNPFTALESSPDLQNLFTVYPKLRAQLHQVYIATLEPPHNCPDSEQRNNSRFDGGRGQVRVRGRSRGWSNDAPWTPQRGQKLAVARIRKFRECEIKESYGLREFSRLLVRLHSSKLSLPIDPKM